MIFNPWRKYPKRKPKEDGWYLCTVPYTVRVFHYDVRKDKWTDTSRQHVFDGYVVYKCCRAPIQENRVYTDGLCERDDVVAWKKLPREYRGELDEQ